MKRLPHDHWRQQPHIIHINASSSNLKFKFSAQATSARSLFQMSLWWISACNYSHNIYKKNHSCSHIVLHFLWVQATLFLVSHVNKVQSFPLPSHCSLDHTAVLLLPPLTRRTSAMLTALLMSIPFSKTLFQQDTHLCFCPSFLQNHHCLDTMVNNPLNICSIYK